jgi:hypothetical protein
MAKFEHPDDPQHPEIPRGCICGRHRDQREHEHDAHRMLQCAPVTSEKKCYSGLLAREAMRVNFPKG